MSQSDASRQPADEPYPTASGQADGTGGGGAGRADGTGRAAS